MRYEPRTVQTSSFRSRRGEVLGRYRVYDTDAGKWAKATEYTTFQRAKVAADKLNDKWIKNPGSIIKKLRKGIRGFIKVSRGKLIIKT